MSRNIFSKMLEISQISDEKILSPTNHFSKWLWTARRDWKSSGLEVQLSTPSSRLVTFVIAIEW